VVEPDPPLAAWQDREDLSLLRLAADHVAKRLRSRLPGRQAGASVRVAEDSPFVGSDLLQDHVPAVHIPVVTAQFRSGARIGGFNQAPRRRDASQPVSVLPQLKWD
jgi:hypothetical protein